MGWEQTERARDVAPEGRTPGAGPTMNLDIVYVGKGGGCGRACSGPL